jgi:WD40 repeat protein
VFPLVSPDGTTLLILSSSGTMTSWRLDGGGLISRLLPRSDDGFVTEYSPDGGTLLVNTNTRPSRVGGPATGLVYPNPVVEVVDARSGDVRSRLDGVILAHPSDDPCCVIARFADGTIGRYDIARQQRVGPAVDVGFVVEDFVVNGDRLWVWSEYGLFEGRIAGVDLESGAVEHRIETGAPLIRMYAPAAGQLTTHTDRDGLIQRRDSSSGAVMEELGDVEAMVGGDALLVAHTFSGDLLAVDPDTLTADDPFPAIGGVSVDTMDLSDEDERLLVLGNDRVARLYDVPSRTQLGTDIAPGDAAPGFVLFVTSTWMRGAAIRDDGREMAITTDAGIVLWDLDPARWTAAACEVAGRNLTRDEWDTYIGDLTPYRKTCPDLT